LPHPLLRRAFSVSPLYRWGSLQVPLHLSLMGSSCFSVGDGDVGSIFYTGYGSFPSPPAPGWVFGVIFVPPFTIPLPCVRPPLSKVSHLPKHVFDPFLRFCARLPVVRAVFDSPCALSCSSPLSLVITRVTLDHNPLFRMAWRSVVPFPYRFLFSLHINMFFSVPPFHASWLPTRSFLCQGSPTPPWRTRRGSLSRVGPFLGVSPIKCGSDPRAVDICLLFPKDVPRISFLSTPFCDPLRHPLKKTFFALPPHPSPFSDQQVFYARFLF